MIGKEIIEKRPVSLAYVQELLKERKKEKELSYEQENSLKYSKNFSKISLKKTNDLIKELMKIEGITPEIAVKIADILPTEKEIIELILPKEMKAKAEVLAKALEIVEKYYKKK